MRSLVLGLVLALWGGAVIAQTAPVWTPAEGDYVGGALATTSGAVLPELKMHYRTLGTPVRDASGHVTNAVLLLHGTGGTGAQFLSPQFSNDLFGPGQPLDVTRYFIVMPDNLGHGQSSRPSQGLRARFPEYGYDDMVEAQRRLLVEGLKVDHLRLILARRWAVCTPSSGARPIPTSPTPSCLWPANRPRSSDAIGCGGRC